MYQNLIWILNFQSNIGKECIKINLLLKICINNFSLNSYLNLNSYNLFFECLLKWALTKIHYFITSLLTALVKKDRMENTPSLTVNDCKLHRAFFIFRPLNLFLISNPYIFHNIVALGRCAEDVVYLEEETISNRGISLGVSPIDKRAMMDFFS